MDGANRAKMFAHKEIGLSVDSPEVLIVRRVRTHRTRRCRHACKRHSRTLSRDPH